MGRRPLVTVVIPTWNRAELLPDAIESVRAQNRDDIEIIVVDDGSTDATPQVLSAYGDEIRQARQENAGPAAARNLGISLARGELIAFLDSDDLWTRTALQSRLDVLERNPATHIALGQTQVMVRQRGENGSRRFEPAAVPAFATLFGAALCRREAFEIAGPLDTALRTGEDIDWFIRCREVRVVTTLVNEVTHLVRRHDGNMTLTDTPRSRGLLIAVKRSLDRRRTEGSGEIAPLHAWDTEDLLEKDDDAL